MNILWYIDVFYTKSMDETLILEYKKEINKNDEKTLFTKKISCYTNNR